MDTPVSRSMKSRRALSPIISTLLMVVVVVAAASIAVLWSSGALQTLSNYFGTQSNAVQEAIAIEDVYYNVANNTLRPYIRNVGPVSVVLTAVFVSWPGGTTKVLAINPARTVGAGQLTSISFASPAFIFPLPCKPSPPSCGGITFTIKAITTLGTSDTFQLFVA